MKSTNLLLFMLTATGLLDCGRAATPHQPGTGCPVRGAAATQSRNAELVVRIATVQAGQSHSTKGNPGPEAN